jgi:Coenzyme PQQ synthesis protein D (PqqD)
MRWWLNGVGVPNSAETELLGVLCVAELFRRNPKVEEAPLGADLMLFEPEKSQFFVLNSTMAYLWRSCDGANSLDRIVESIPSKFAEADGHPVATEMKAALDELLALGMITRN